MVCLNVFQVIPSSSTWCIRRVAIACCSSVKYHRFGLEVRPGQKAEPTKVIVGVMVPSAQGQTYWPRDKHLTDDEQPPPASSTVNAIEVLIGSPSVRPQSLISTYASRYPENMEPRELPINHTPARLNNSSPLNQILTDDQPDLPVPTDHIRIN